MHPTQYTLWSLLQQYAIQIPIIQRDYAQGRSDDKATAIRHKFIQSLYESLTLGQSLDLDFVYGDVNSQRQLVPLDGQQRLTTLFLLHWYLAAVEGKLDEARECLQKFTYETRSNSREFCNRLVACAAADYEGVEADKLGLRLRDAAWFQPVWERDPTVQAMLTMLTAIAGRFGHSQDLFEKLTDATAPLISFQFLTLENAGLTDDLYLKMNARGKALTDFENWKAEFDQFLQQQHPELQHEFGLKIDGAWTDLFWQYRTPGTALIDEAFKRYLDFVTRMLEQMQGGQVARSMDGLDKGAGLSFDQYVSVYSKCENIDFLFRSLDLLHQVEDLEALFTGIFSVRGHQPGKVTLFEGEANLFHRCIYNQQFDIKSQLLLFVLLHYAVKANALAPNNVNLVDLMRIGRNLLERVRQQNDTEFNSNLREDALPSYIADMVTLLSADGGQKNVYEVLASPAPPKLKGFLQRAIEHETAKAQMLAKHTKSKADLHEVEDLTVFRGTVHNLDIVGKQKKLGDFKRAVQQIWADGVPQDLIMRAWLTVGNYSLETPGRTMLGNKWFFGSARNWYTILSNDASEVKTSLPLFLEAFLEADAEGASKKLKRMVANWLADKQEKNWQYYLIKYPQMSEDSTGYYAWESDYQVRLLTKMNLRARHIEVV
jgi:hypothetical protein